MLRDLARYIRPACWLGFALAAGPSCAQSAQMINAPGGGGASAYGPVKRTSEEIGRIRYSADGSSDVVQQRKEDAYRQMYIACNKEYEIIREELVAAGGAASVIDTPIPYVGGSVATAVAQPMSSWSIEFRCLASPRTVPDDNSIIAQTIRCKQSGGTFILFTQECQPRERDVDEHR